MTIEETLRREIERSDLNLRQIATRADVSYMHLWRWYSGKTKTLSVTVAEYVFKALTGRSLQ